MPDAFIVRLFFLVSALALVWIVLGAPLYPAEWQDVPLRLRVMLTQLPGRMGSILLLWP